MSSYIMGDLKKLRSTKPEECWLLHHQSDTDSGSTVIGDTPEQTWRRKNEKKKKKLQFSSSKYKLFYLFFLILSLSGLNQRALRLVGRYEQELSPSELVLYSK